MMVDSQSITILLNYLSKKLLKNFQMKIAQSFKLHWKANKKS